MKSETAVVLPLWKNELTEFEEISFRQCLYILKKHDIVFVTYPSLKLDKYIFLCRELGVDYQRVNFNQTYFEGVRGYNRLLKSVKFYLSFLKYRYVLIHQLDCFVFRDDLDYWCRENYSYIGAPWLEGYTKALPNAPVIGVGNGGLSLRKVRDHLRVLYSFSLLKSPAEIINDCCERSNRSYFSKLKCSLYELAFCNNTFFLLNRGGLNEDVFWSNYANRFSWYQIPDWQIAASFSIEVQPRRFIRTNSNVPFGCHAWWKYDLDFWRPHIRRFGYEI